MGPVGKKNSAKAKEGFQKALHSLIDINVSTAKEAVTDIKSGNFSVEKIKNGPSYKKLKNCTL